MSWKRSQTNKKIKKTATCGKSCSWCESNRTIVSQKNEIKSKEMLKDLNTSLDNLNTSC